MGRIDNLHWRTDSRSDEIQRAWHLEIIAPKTQFNKPFDPGFLGIPAIEAFKLADIGFGGGGVLLPRKPVGPSFLLFLFTASLLTRVDITGDGPRPKDGKELYRCSSWLSSITLRNLTACLASVYLERIDKCRLLSNVMKLGCRLFWKMIESSHSCISLTGSKLLL